MCVEEEAIGGPIDREQDSQRGMAAQYSQYMPIIFLILQEMDLLEDDAVVYKLIGPALIKQEVAEAKDTVSKRLDYIAREM